jgi:cyclic pyranopterin phosphate synthase
MLSHIDKKGNAKIVDISNKVESLRIAIASGKILVSKNVFSQISLNTNKKGDILTVAKIAGIMAAKNTSNLIPLCHSITLDDVQINFRLDQKQSVIHVCSTVKCNEKTGVEMEALTATSITLLTIYDMCKAIDKKMIISEISLDKKSGGKSSLEN